MPLLSKLYPQILNFTLPHCCPLCTEPSDDLLCLECKASLPYLKRACRQCALPLADHTTALCGECQSHPPAVDMSVCAFELQRDTAWLITHFKQSQQRHYADHLAHTLAQQVQLLRNTTDYALPECLYPVPIHWQTLFKRGFNQSLYIAETLGKILNIPVEQGFTKTHRTPQQKTLDRKAREKNLMGSFNLRGLSLPKHIAIIDDVVTTGATTHALASLAKTSGIERVDVWALARTPKNQ